MLRQQTKPTSRIHGIIVDGGEKPNIIPERSEMDYYVRGSRDEDVIDLMEKLIACAKGAASATGKFLFHWINVLEYMFENEGLQGYYAKIDVVRRNMKLDLPVAAPRSKLN